MPTSHGVATIGLPRRLLLAGLLAAADASAQQGPGGWSAEPPVSPALSRDADIFGWQLMTHQERNAYRERMRTAKTV